MDGETNVIDFIKHQTTKEVEEWLEDAEFMEIPEELSDPIENKRRLISWYEEYEEEVKGQLRQVRKRRAEIKRLDAIDDGGEIALEQMDIFPDKVEALIDA